MIPPEFIDEVLARVDIVEIVEPRVALKKSGQNYSGLCPFHNEKTPSFSVSQDIDFSNLVISEDLIASGLTYSIVRPTAFFKSLSGQVARVQAGKPFLVFGDGQLTACKPISDDDLGRFMAGCLTDPERQNQILPIGGPGPAITPLNQGKALFRMLGQEPKFRHVPVGMMDAIIGGLNLGGKLSSKLAAKADLARIGRYYATESMLVWDAAQQRYDAEATPEFGSETLFDFYEKLLSGAARIDLGEHAVF